MIVLKYFYEKMSVFGPLMNKKEQNEQQKTEKKYESLVREEEKGSVRTICISLHTFKHSRHHHRQ